jgi:hypothetical protein
MLRKIENLSNDVLVHEQSECTQLCIDLAYSALSQAYSFLQYSTCCVRPELNVLLEPIGTPLAHRLETVAKYPA